MGALCNCNAKNTQNTSNFHSFSSTKDPRLADLYTHLKILEAKLNSNLTSIEDFRQLLIETKKEPIAHRDITLMMQQIEEALDEAKAQLNSVNQKKNQVKSMTESVDLNTLGRLSRPMESKQNINEVTNGGVSKYFESDDVDKGALFDNRSAIDDIYKKVSDALKVLRKAEEDAQVQMLKWENFVIQHEKMKVLREEINESFKTDSEKISEIEKKQKELKDLMEYFQHVCHIIDQCQSEALLNSLANGSSIRDDGESGSQLDILQQSASILKDSFEDEIRDEELEQLSDLRDQLASFQIKMEHIERHMEKAKAKVKVAKQKREEINEFDIYELDSFFKKQQDFLNNLEINLYKTNQMLSELNKKYNNNHTLLDICETVYLRKLEINYCLNFIQRVEKQYAKLVKDQEKAVMHYHVQQQNGGSATQILKKTVKQRQKIMDNMNNFLNKLSRIEKVDINMKDLEQIEGIMTQLSGIQKECNDSLQSIYEEYIVCQKLNVINGKLGWKISIQTVYDKLSIKIQKVRLNMDSLSSSLMFHQEKCSDLINSYFNTEYDTKKQEIDQLNQRQTILIEKHRILSDQMAEVETNLDRWLSAKTASSMIVQEGIDIEEQEWQVQEFINVMTQVAHLKFFSDKLQMNCQRNHRLIQRSEIEIYSQSSLSLKKQLYKQIEITKDLALKAEQKANQFKSLMIIYQPNSGQFMSGGSSHNNSKHFLDQDINNATTGLNELSYDDHNKSIAKLITVLNTCSQQAVNLNEQVKLLNIDVTQRIQTNPLSYQQLFSDDETITQFREKAKNTEIKVQNLFNQVKSINQDIQEIFSHFAKQGGQSERNNLKLNYSRQQSVGDESVASLISNLNNQQPKNKFQLNSTLGDDDLNRTSIPFKNANIDDIDQALYRCIEEQKCFKNITIEKIKKGLYKLEKREFQFKILNGNNLSIRMFAGYIFADCLVHFDEELLHIVRN